MEDSIPFGSRDYFVLLALLAFARGMDFFSTWVATPRLVLEGNPVAKWLGWRRGMLLNIIVVLVLPHWLSTTIAMSTMSVLVAGRNFHSAWLMRTMGEEAYRDWYLARMMEARRGLHVLCLLGETFAALIVGGALVIYSSNDEYLLVIPTSIGVGIIAYGSVVAFFTLLSAWRNRRNFLRRW